MNAADIAPIFGALADPTRLGLFQRMVDAREIGVGALVEGSAVSQPAVSQHLKALREAGLAVERREGRRIYYRPDPTGLAPLVDWLSIYGVFWAERFENLRTLLKEIDP